MNPEDWPAVREIYEEGIATKMATFETSAGTWEKWDQGENGIWTLQAGIFADNHPSIKLHEKVGFRLVGTREKLGRLDGVWRDIVLMERRSDVVGV